MSKKILFFLILFMISANNLYASEYDKLFSAVKGNDINLANQLIKGGANVNGIDETGQSPLHHACYLGYVDIVKILINSGADVNKKVPERNLTPLYGATMNGDLDVVTLLVDNGAKINIKDDQGTAPLMAACWIGSLEVVGYLITKGGRFNIKNDYGTNLLHYACQSDNFELVNFLIEKGCEVNNQAQNGATPLHMAVARGELSIVELLINSGAKSNFKMKWDAELSFNINAPILKDEDIFLFKFSEGQTALDVAVQKGNEQLIKIIKNSIK